MSFADGMPSGQYTITRDLERPPDSARASFTDAQRGMEERRSRERLEGEERDGAIQTAMTTAHALSSYLFDRLLHNDTLLEPWCFLFVYVVTHHDGTREVLSEHKFYHLDPEVDDPVPTLDTIVKEYTPTERSAPRDPAAELPELPDARIRRSARSRLWGVGVIDANWDGEWQLRRNEALSNLDKRPIPEIGAVCRLWGGPTGGAVMVKRQPYTGSPDQVWTSMLSHRRPGPLRGQVRRLSPEFVDSDLVLQRLMALYDQIQHARQQRVPVPQPRDPGRHHNW